MRSALLFPLLVASLANSQSPHGSSANSYVARAGNIFISESEFLERFELTPAPHRHRKPQLEQEKLTFLLSMVAEKLLTQEALDMRLDTMGAIRDDLQELLKEISRDELYKREIRRQVEVSPREVSTGLKRVLKELRVRFMFFEEAADAVFARSQIKRGENLSGFQVDSSMKALSDTASIVWGDADPLVEDAAYSLKGSEISPVIHAGGGYYILQLLQARPVASSMQPGVLREKVTAKIRSRKERAKVREFLKETLSGKTGFSPPVAFKYFVEKLAGVFREQPLREQWTVDGPTADSLARLCADRLTDTLIVGGSRFWSIGEALVRLRLSGFSVRRIGELPHRLFDEFREWVDRELLAQEAQRRGIDTSAEVKKIIQPWKEQILAAMLKQHIVNRVTVSDGEVYSVLKASDSVKTIPEVKIQALHTSTLEEMRRAVDDLSRGESLTNVIEQRGDDPQERTRKGVTDFFPVTDRPPVGEIAWGMEVGQRYGPIQDSTGYVLFELRDKKDALLSARASDRFKKTKMELLRGKQQRKLNLILAQAARNRGYEVFEDRLRRVAVTPIPMLAFRYLGFGGRMFAAPFVDRQLEWLNVSPAPGTISP